MITDYPQHQEKRQECVCDSCPCVCAANPNYDRLTSEEAYGIGVERRRLDDPFWMPSKTSDQNQVKSTIEVSKLSLGDIVMALKHLDSNGANVRFGTLGVIFTRTNEYGDNCGPMVRWMNSGACNIYDGDVRLV